MIHLSLSQSHTTLTALLRSKMWKTSHVLGSRTEERFVYFVCRYFCYVGPTQPPIQWVPGTLYLGVKRLGREAYHSSAEVKG
jgi:hypothetical protein